MANWEVTEWAGVLGVGVAALALASAVKGGPSALRQWRISTWVRANDRILDHYREVSDHKNADLAAVFTGSKDAKELVDDRQRALYWFMIRFLIGLEEVLLCLQDMDREQRAWMRYVEAQLDSDAVGWCFIMHDADAPIEDSTWHKEFRNLLKAALVKCRERASARG